MRVSPLWRRRGAAFWAHRRGRVALLIFAAIFGLGLLANFVANDRPLLVSYNGRIFSPVLQRVPGQKFGPEFFATATDYTDPAVQTAIRAHGWMVWPPIPYRYDTIVWAAATAPAPPCARDWLGTDEVSRDVLARLIYGVRLSILFAVGLTIPAAAIGIVIGAMQGFYGGLTDLALQRFTEIWSGMPVLFLLMILASLTSPGVFGLLSFMLAFSWMGLASVVRAEFFRARAQDYVRAARALGVPDRHIMLRHMLPNAAVAVLTFLPFILAESIVLLAGLDFLGYGLPAGTPSLGALLEEARENPQAPWLGIAAFVTLGGILALLIFIGEAARAAFDPRRTE